MYRVPFNGVMIECDTDQEARTLVAGDGGKPAKTTQRAGAADYWAKVKKVQKDKGISSAAARKIVAKMA